MGEIAERIRDAVREERFALSAHALTRLRQRRVPAWQAVEGTVHGRILGARPYAKPHPIAEFEIMLADGIAAKAVWSWREARDIAVLVTLHFFDQ